MQGRGLENVVKCMISAFSLIFVLLSFVFLPDKLSLCYPVFLWKMNGYGGKDGVMTNKLCFLKSRLLVIKLRAVFALIT